ncbi:MAG: sodium:solute symporter family protein [Lachnospiraceae bacterium]|nr:sodium:solute symporter family protein [Lachnospiraceae bacterium]
MNAFLTGMLISMAAYIVIGLIISRGVKTANDFFVAGRHAPTFLLIGSLVASYCGTGLYFGDAGEAFAGIYSPLVTLGAMLVVGYILGGVFFGRYLRRSECNTIPEFFGKRFDSVAVRKLAAITELITIVVYLLSTMQGIGTLMTLVTGVNYVLCIFLALVTFTVLTVTSGSKGVLITDTIMFGFFTAITVIVILIATGKGGGWFHIVGSLAQSRPEILSWAGNPNYLYPTGTQNFIWAVAYGVVWMSVCMVGPWQASRYLMAKNEHSVIRSSIWAAFFVFLLEFIVKTGAALFNYFDPELASQSHIIVWVSTNLVPMALGVIMLTGILAAGISSATTFLSIISSAVANDLMEITDDKKKLQVGRITIIAAAAVVMLLAAWNPPQVFWIMFLGATVVASSWLPVCIASVWSKKITKAGAFTGMLCGFVGCGAMKIYASVAGITLPVLLDPFFIGFFANIIGMVIATALTKKTAEEESRRLALFVMPDSEKDPAEMQRTRRTVLASISLGVIITAVMLIFWAIPYRAAL